MTIRGFRQGSMAQLAAVVTAALFAAGTPAAWAGPAASAKPATALEVQSEPAGAAVFVDGQLKGATPVAVEGIVSGDHTVRIVKDGFLENSRVVSVPTSGRSLHVALTPTRIPARAAMMQVEPEPAEGGGGGGGKKWLYIGLGAAALTAGGVVLYLATKGESAAVNSVTANPASGILQGVTSVAFTANTKGDKPTYSWNFGDGQTSNVASPTHVFQTAGTLTVTLTVTSGGKSASGSTSVTVGGLAGAWSGRITNGFSYNCNLTQTGSSVGGTCGDSSRTWTITGSVSAPLAVNLTASRSGFFPWRMNGNLSGDFNSITGTTTGLVDSNGNPVTPAFTLNR